MHSSRRGHSYWWILSGHSWTNGCGQFFKMASSGLFRRTIFFSHRSFTLHASSACNPGLMNPSICCRLLAICKALRSRKYSRSRLDVELGSLKKEQNRFSASFCWRASSASGSLPATTSTQQASTYVQSQQPKNWRRTHITVSEFRKFRRSSALCAIGSYGPASGVAAKPRMMPSDQYNAARYRSEA